MNRRNVVMALAGAAIAFALPVRAQKSGLPVIGLLYGASPKEWPERLQAFRQGLAETGYAEGRNVTVEVRQFGGHYEGVPAALDDLLQRKVAVIVATGSPQLVLAAKAATATVPIVVTFGGDPVKAGLVASLNRPGGNVTGVSILTVEVAAKLLDVFREILPKATAVAALVNPASPIADAYAKAIQDGAQALGLRLDVLKAATEREIDAAFAALVERRSAGLLVTADPFFELQRDQLIALAERQRTPTFFFVREFVAGGGLASFGTSFSDVARLTGVYVGRILKGAKPGDLPVGQPTKFELVVNLKTAKALGLAVPPELLLRADEVIQ